MKTRLLISFLVIKFSISLGQDNKYIQEAKLCFKKEDYKCAEEALLEAIKKNPTDYFLFLNLGTAQRRIGKKEEALLSYNKALELKPGSISILNSRASLYRQLGNMQASLNDYNTALQKAPDDEETLLNRAFVFKEMGQLDSSIKDINKVLTLNPKNFKAQSNLASIKKGQGKLQEALEDFKILVKNYPDEAVLWNNLADTEMELNDYKNAIEHIYKAIRIDPKYANGYLTKGEIQLKMGYRIEACKDFSRALELGVQDKERETLESYLKDCK